MDQNRKLALVILLMATSACKLEVSEESILTCDGPRSTRTAAGVEMGVLRPQTGADEIAQSFKPESSQTVSRVQLKLRKQGSPGGRLTLKLERDGGGLPDGAPLATGTYDVRSLSEDGGAYVMFTFDQPAELKRGGTYWLRLDASYAQSETHLVHWQGSDGNPYADGKALAKVYSMNNSWRPVSADLDLAFKFDCFEQREASTQE